MRRKHSQEKKKGETLNTEQEPQLKSGKPGICSEYYWVLGLLYKHYPKLKQSWNNILQYQLEVVKSRDLRRGPQISTYQLCGNIAKGGRCQWNNECMGYVQMD